MDSVAESVHIFPVTIQSVLEGMWFSHYERWMDKQPHWAKQSTK